MTGTLKTFYGVLLVALAVSLVSVLTRLPDNSASAQDEPKPEIPAAELKVAQDLSAAFEYVADVIEPSVVNISSIKHIKPGAKPGTNLPPEWRQFFGDQLPKFFTEPKVPKEYEEEGLGSGVIIRKDGYILTNNHVVAGADEVTVTLANNDQHKAKVIGTDPKTDLAVVRIKAENLTPAVFGDSDKLKIGEWVVAAGEPFGLKQTITSGIISAVGRANVGVADYEDFIQTDAPINPGNSGGPLVNLKGHVIGINTAIFTRSGGYMGIGFAIPSNMAKMVMDSLIEHGKVIRGWLGVGIQKLTQDLAKSFGFNSTNGVLVSDVTDNGPAKKAGIQQGDIIVRYNGKAIDNMNQLRDAVAATSPGTKVKVEVFRDGETKTLTVTIGEQEKGMAAAKGEQAGEATGEEKLGMTVENLTPDLAEALGIKQAKGVVVTKVEPFGDAAKAGIRKGNVIVKVAGEPVNTVAEFKRELKKRDLTKGVRLTVMSEGMQRFVFLKVEKKAE